MAEDLVKHLRNPNHAQAATLAESMMKQAADLIEQQAASLARFSDNMRQNYDAFTAMRNDVNEIVGNMASQESTLQYGPEMAHECEVVVEAVRASLAAKDKEIERLQSSLAVKDVELNGTIYRSKLLLDAKIHWMDRAAAAESRAEQAERVFTDICEELGCKPDNEAALEAVAALKRALAEAVEVLRPFAAWIDAVDAFPTASFPDHASIEIGHETGDPQPTKITGAHLRAARAFVAQHGSDSREG
ncbi:MAG: hypothetical protein WBF99_12605 [Xanthobacteraceae bacterium]